MRPKCGGFGKKRGWAHAILCPMRKATIALIVAVLLGCFPSRASGEAPRRLGHVALHQALKDLGNDFRLMCVAAHPDDEDGATLAYYRMRHGVRTFAVIATRGEGGQNEIGPELYEALGVIRTREMRAAAEIEGAELRFLDLPEFGFSKSLEETFEIWGHEETLRRMVAMIRENKPHVIITHHGRMKDHGHHQAIGQVVQEAFEAAAEPAQFPEQVTEWGTWQVQRLYIRNWEEQPEQVRVPLHDLEPARGQTYAEIAAEALRAHESQGMTFFIQRLYSLPYIYYDLVKQAEDSPDGPRADAAMHGAMFEGLSLPPVLSDAPALREERRALSSAGAASEAVLPRLIALVRQLQERSPDEPELRQQAEEATAIAAGIQLRAKVMDEVVVPGQEVRTSLQFLDHGTQDATWVHLKLLSPHRNFPLVEHATALSEHCRNVFLEGANTSLPAELPLSLPHERYLFAPHLFQPVATASAQVKLKEGVVLNLSAPVHADVAATVALDFLGPPYLFRAGAREPLRVSLRAKNHAPVIATLPGQGRNGVSGEVRLEAASPLRTEPSAVAVALKQEDAEAFTTFEIRAPRKLSPGVYPLRATLDDTAAAEAQVHVVDVALPKRTRVGLISAYDTTLQTTLTRLGVRHEVLHTPESLTELDRFTTVIVDMRAYQYRPDLVAANAALLSYVYQGGTVIVMYQKTFEWSPRFAPYSIEIGRNRVTREDAPVRHLLPKHPLFTTPNQITAADWEGWVQERGLYFAASWDARYTPLLEMQDPGEAIPPGALLVAGHGNGTYVYCALALYRQLRELHPGALRLFANLLAL